MVAALSFISCTSVFSEKLSGKYPINPKSVVHKEADVEKVMEKEGAYSIRSVVIEDDDPAVEYLPEVRKDISVKFLTYLFYEENLLIEESLEEFFDYWGEELAITNVYSKGNSDILMLSQGAGCGGCVAFLDRYFVVDKTSLDLETVEFKGPKELGDLLRRGVPMYALFSPDNSKIALIHSVSSPGHPPDVDTDKDYFEEIWIYSFDSADWKKYLELPKNTTTLCNGMGLLPTDEAIYWEDSGKLRIKPHTIDEAFEGYCWA